MNLLKVPTSNSADEVLSARQNALFAPLLSMLFLLLMSLALVGCGASNDASEEGDGEVVIGLTDAEGDFATYTVDVLSLTLTKANGAVVETLPLSTRVDFAQYTELTEFLTAATVPNGAYVKASMVLDYRNADIRVENAAGDAVQVSNIVGADGMALDEIEVTVNLDGRNKLIVAPGLPSHITLDFDLKASNTVSFDDMGIPTQVVEPFLLADVALEQAKLHRLRGPLARVDVDGNRFSVILRPFHHRIDNDRQNHFGQLEVVINDTTLFDISGETYEGQTGLVALDAQPAFTATIVMGDLKFNPRRFEAREVYTGASVPGGDLDVVTGNVIARSGDVLTVKGATLVRAGGSVIFNDEITINLGDMTTVKRQLSMGNEYSISDVSVGQRVRVFGVLTNDIATELEMDAGVSNQGRVMMRLTTLRGTVVGVVGIPGIALPFIMDLQGIDGRNIGLFDFSGTGDVVDNGSDNDSDPASYEINVATLDVSGFTEGTPIKVRGFVRSFGQVTMGQITMGQITTAASSDFDARTVVDVSALKAVMVISWDPASNTAVESISAESVRLDLSGVGRLHQVARSRVVVDLLNETSAPSITSNNDTGEGLYWVAQAGSHQLHTTFASFTADLDARLNAGALVKHVLASGQYDNASVTIMADFVSVLVE